MSSRERTARSGREYGVARYLMVVVALAFVALAPFGHTEFPLEAADHHAATEVETAGKPGGVEGAFCGDPITESCHAAEILASGDRPFVAVSQGARTLVRPAGSWRRGLAAPPDDPVPIAML